MPGNDLKLLWNSDAFALREGRNVIGRKDADITIADKSLSKEHALILRQGARLEIEDAGSTNGTSVNDAPIAGRVAISPGDKIRLGNVELKIVDGAAPDSSSPDSSASQTTPTLVPPPEAKPPAPRARFTVMSGEEKGKAYPLDPAKPFTIGTKDENSLPLKGEGISRYHAEVVYEAGAWLLKDLGSRNGTQVGARRVDHHELARGDEVQIGSAHLRFEIEEPGAAAKASALVDFVKRDPKAIAKNPHLRQAVMLLVGAGVALWLVLGRQQPPPPPVAVNEIQDISRQAVDLLAKDDAERAETLLGKALRQHEAQPLLVKLNELARLWRDHRSPVTFDWKSAIDTIEGTLRVAASNGGLDSASSDWLAKARAQAETEIPNSALRLQADAALGRGQNSLQSGKKDEGLVQLAEALSLYKSMPAASVFSESSRARAETVRRVLLETYRKDAEAKLQDDGGKTPDWDGAIKLFAEARKYTITLDERRTIEEASGSCETNLRDQTALVEVNKIVQKLDAPGYARARELLEGISPNSRCARDADAYRNWFKADDLVRSAIKAYNAGAFEQASKLMTDASKVPDIKPEVTQNVLFHLQRWGKVAQAWTDGYALEQKGEDARARDVFTALLKLEPSAENVYHQRAEKELGRLDEKRQEEVDRTLKQGIESLDAARFGEALAKFSALAASPQGGPLRGQIEDAVARVNKEKGLFKEANRIVVQGKKDKLPWARDVAQLLARFLPEKDPDREAATQLLAKVKP
jgi:pSer/pThr/pTyr-binding forkhead associated (FHA) protein